MNSSLELGKIMGIPVRLHWTFLLVILYVAWAFASFSQTVYGKTYGFGGIEPAQLRWLYSLLFAVVLFACVALHELGHSYIAHKNGISIKSITLYFFGGVASMEEIPRNPRLELQMAFAGPAVSGVRGIDLGLPGRTCCRFWWCRQCSGHHALDFRHHESHPHGLQSPPCLSHGWGPPLAGLVCHPHALRKSYPACCGYRKDLRDSHVSAGPVILKFHAPLCGVLRLCGCI